MNVENKNPIIIVIGGKSRHGKDTLSSYIMKSLEKEGKIAINLQYSSYIKEYAKKISDWDGSEDTKPRQLLQQLGTDIIRKKIDENFFIKKIIDDIKVYSYFFDVITISDARFKKEFDYLKDEFPNVVCVKIVRPNFNNGLTLEQLMHSTETDLDDYDKMDYVIYNDSTLQKLEEKAINLTKEVLKK